MGDSVIQARDIAKIYRLWASPEARIRAAFWSALGRKKVSPGDMHEHAALEGVNLVVGRGESVGIIGLNGSGKSTLLQIIAGTLQPTQIGRAHV